MSNKLWKGGGYGRKKASMETYRLFGMRRADSKRRAVSAKLAILLVAVGLVAGYVPARSLSAGAAQRARKERELDWAPPNVDAPVATISAIPACSLPEVLRQAGQRVNQLIDHLQNFVAHERVRYEQRDEEENWSWRLPPSLIMWLILATKLGS